MICTPYPILFGR